MLIESRTRVDSVDRLGWTPLHFAAQRHFVPIASALLAAGAPVDSADGHGNTPLSNAVFESRGRGEMITLIREHGADIHRRNAHGVSPSELAARIANYDVRRWLE